MGSLRFCYCVKGKENQEPTLQNGQSKSVLYIWNISHYYVSQERPFTKWGSEIPTEPGAGSSLSPSDRVPAN